MRALFETLMGLGALVTACLLMPLAWRHDLYASAALCFCIGLLGGGTIIASQLRLTRRLRRREPSVVRSVDREKLRNRALLDHAPVPLLIQHVDGTLRAANRAARRLFRTEGLVRSPPPELLSALTNDTLDPGKHMIRLASGGDAPRTYALSVGQGGGAGGIVSYLALTDIEAGLNAAEAQALRDLLQILSHEIMNSLTPIVSLSETAAELFSDRRGGEQGATDMLIVEALGTIRRRAEGLDRFVRGYRDLARLPAPDLKPVALDALLRETATLFDARWGQSVALDLVLPSVKTMVRLDWAQMQQVFLNLLNNASEASADRPQAMVQLGARALNGVITVTVRDNGSGIPPERAARIFDPFVSFKTDGNGIGLTLARQIVQAHGGSLSLAGRQPEGAWTTEFRIVL